MTLVPPEAAPRVFDGLMPLYKEAFPPSERIDPDTLKPSLSRGVRWLWVTSEDGAYVSFALAIDLGRSAWLLEYMATHSPRRSDGIGRKLLDRVRSDLLAAHAARLYIEVEPPGDQIGADSLAARRLAWYKRQGAHILLDSDHYAIPDQSSGGAVPMLLLVILLGESPLPRGRTLELDLVAIFDRSYGTELQRDQVRWMVQHSHADGS